MLTFRLQNNTDSVDIRAKCLGISSWVDGDSQSILNTARGLHIQIRHNGDKATFEAANQLAKLLTKAPAMLEQLKLLHANAKERGTDWVAVGELLKELE